MTGHRHKLAKTLLFLSSACLLAAIQPLGESSSVEAATISLKAKNLFYADSSSFSFGEALRLSSALGKIYQNWLLGDPMAIDGMHDNENSHGNNSSGLEFLRMGFEQGQIFRYGSDYQDKTPIEDLSSSQIDGFDLIKADTGDVISSNKTGQFTDLKDGSYRVVLKPHLGEPQPYQVAFGYDVFYDDLFKANQVRAEQACTSQVFTVKDGKVYNEAGEGLEDDKISSNYFLVLKSNEMKFSTDRGYFGIQADGTLDKEAILAQKKLLPLGQYQGISVFRYQSIPRGWSFLNVSGDDYDRANLPEIYFKRTQLPIPTLSNQEQEAGIRFTGWQAHPDMLKAYPALASHPKMSDWDIKTLAAQGDMHFNALFDVPNHRISFEAAADQGDFEGLATKTITLPALSQLDKSQIPQPTAKPGYQFVGWIDNQAENLIDPLQITAPLVKDRHYTALFKAVNKPLVTLTLKYLSESGQTLAPDDRWVFSPGDFYHASSKTLPDTLDFKQTTNGTQVTLTSYKLIQQSGPASGKIDKDTTLTYTYAIQQQTVLIDSKTTTADLRTFWIDVDSGQILKEVTKLANHGALEGYRYLGSRLDGAGHLIHDMTHLPATDGKPSESLGIQSEPQGGQKGQQEGTAESKPTKKAQGEQKSGPIAKVPGELESIPTTKVPGKLESNSTTKVPGETGKTSSPTVQTEQVESLLFQTGETLNTGEKRASGRVEIGPVDGALQGQILRQPVAEQNHIAQQQASEQGQLLRQGTVEQKQIVLTAEGDQETPAGQVVATEKTLVSEGKGQKEAQTLPNTALNTSVVLGLVGVIALETAYILFGKKKA